jgi:Zn-finger nucleic acid-binding protein
MRASGLGFQCEYCHTVVVPEMGADGVRVLGEIAGQSCPVCAAGMAHGLLAGMAIEYCAKCHGLLVAMDAFAALIDALRAEDAGTILAPPGVMADLERRINCPHCHRAMEAHFYAGPGHVVMDSCENCQVNWMDAGEMQRIARTPRDFA